MTDEQQRWCDEVNRLVREAGRAHEHAFNLPLIDIAVGHGMGYTPVAVANALLGYNTRVVTAIINEMRFRGAFPPERETTSEPQ